MASFLDEVAREAAEDIHARRNNREAVAAEVRKKLAEEWEDEEPKLKAQGKVKTKDTFEMIFHCEYSYISPEEMMALLPDKLQADVAAGNITCRQNMFNAALYQFEFTYGKKRDQLLADLEKDAPPSIKVARTEAQDEKEAEVEDGAKDAPEVEDGAKGAPEGEDAPEGDAALEVKDDEVALAKESVAERAERVRVMTQEAHKTIMTRAVEALGFTVGPSCALGLAWERALLNQKGREASVAYAAAIAEVEASA